MKLTLGEYDPDFSQISGWFYSEKLDGIRAEWDGRRLWTRTGNPIPAPADFLARLPDGVAVSGELYLGRGRFGKVISAVQTGPLHPLWREMRLVAFDLPEAGLAIPDMARRMDCYCLDRLEFLPVDGARLEGLLEELVAQGGEGLVLRSPDGRTGMKYKLWRDAEATVLAAVPGKQSVRCRADNGAAFSLATYGQSIPAGVRVTYKFMEVLSSGKPRSPIFLAIRDYEGAA